MKYTAEDIHRARTAVRSICENESPLTVHSYTPMDHSERIEHIVDTPGSYVPGSYGELQVENRLVTYLSQEITPDELEQEVERLKALREAEREQLQEQIHERIAQRKAAAAAAEAERIAQAERVVQEHKTHKRGRFRR